MGNSPVGKKILIMGAYSESLVNFRGDLIRALVAAGHEVVAMAKSVGTEQGAWSAEREDGGKRGEPGNPRSEIRNPRSGEDGGIGARLAGLGAAFRSYPVQRNGMNPLKDLQTFFALRRTFAKLSPDIVLAYTIKPVVWGGLAFRSLRSQGRFHALITGLGLAFQPGGFRQRLLTGLVTRLYREALRKADKVIFQNQENREVFVQRNIVDRAKTVVMNGSGVNLEHFSEQPLPPGGLTFLTIARLLGDKGLRELQQAALLVGERRSEVGHRRSDIGGRRSDIGHRRSEVTIRLLGPADPSPDGIPLEKVRNWQAAGGLEYLGETLDVRPDLAACHVYVLPSYHEGMPRTVLEAMATGRPIITTDVPGCRETVPLTARGKSQKEQGDAVMEGENGFLVQAKTAAALAEAMQRFIDHPELIPAMGARSRSIAAEKFDVHKINHAMLEILAPTQWAQARE